MKRFIMIVTMCMCFVSPVLKSATAFEFDVWKSGMMLDQVFKTAQNHDIPLTTSGVEEPGERGVMHFRPEIREETKQFRDFCYKDKIMEKTAVVTLHFTPISRRLCQICICWPNADDAQQKEVLLGLTKAFGEPQKFSPAKELLSLPKNIRPPYTSPDTQFFSPNQQNIIFVQLPAEKNTFLSLNYNDLAMTKQEQTESQTLRQYLKIRYQQQDENRM